MGIGVGGPPGRVIREGVGRGRMDRGLVAACRILYYNRYHREITRGSPFGLVLLGGSEDEI